MLIKKKLRREKKKREWDILKRGEEKKSWKERDVVFFTQGEEEEKEVSVVKWGIQVFFIGVFYRWRIKY
jgi:hypothetical protein